MSGKRNVIFAENEVYHVFNRSVANEPIFVKKKDINRTLDLVGFYRYEQNLRFSFFERLAAEEKKSYLNWLSRKKPIVEIYAYSIMPNHFHFLVKQNSKNGVQKFLSYFQNSFAKFFNIKNKRFGPLFTRPFKAKHVSAEEELLHLSRYIHLNPVTAYLMEYPDLKENNLTSYPFYLKKEKEGFVNTEMILGLVGSTKNYEKFVANQVDYQRKLSKIKHLLL